jgi:hypothetical protein
VVALLPEITDIQPREREGPVRDFCANSFHWNRDEQAISFSNRSMTIGPNRGRDARGGLCRR